jgi:FdrA protein
MLDNELRIKRLQQEAEDPETAVLLLDVVLGHGAHPDPASELAPAIARARATAQEGGRRLEAIAVLVGTDEDPQDVRRQAAQLEAAGVHVEFSNEAAARRAGQQARTLNPLFDLPPVDLAVLHEPLQAINVGLQSFSDSLAAQGVPSLQVDWRPPAGGNERLMGILARMQTKH